jgi:biopolymer transport protein ExbB
MLGHTTSGIVAATLWLLIAFSVLTWTLVVMKGWLQLRISRQNDAFLDAFWNARDLAENERIARDSQGPLAQVGRAGFDALRQLGWQAEGTPRCAPDVQPVLERRLRGEAQKALRKLESGLMVLATVGSTAPFVGLFGTVWGIMHALQGISRAGSAGLDVVAGPIGEALVATAFGIATAIPAVMAYNYGLRRVNLYAADLEAFADDFLHHVLKPGVGLRQE